MKVVKRKTYVPPEIHRLLLKRSEIYRELIKKGYLFYISPADDSFIFVDGNYINVGFPRNLSLEAKVGLIIFELYYMKCIEKNGECSHADHIETAYKFSTREEKKLIRKGLEEFFGEKLRFRSDWRYYCKFFQ